MLMVYMQGMMFGAALIMPLGPQNMFVMNQGMQRQYHLMTAGLCTLSDVILICAGIFGGSALLVKSSLLLNLVTCGGVLFLLWYGGGNFRAALVGINKVSPDRVIIHDRWRSIVTVMAVTWLNPHVWIDTFVVTGSVGGQLAAAARGWFAFGSVSASLLWFFSLAWLAYWLSPWLQAARVQRMIHFLVAMVMWWMALKLAQGAFW
ncbi:LysE family transporter [Erwinia psidii]|uniref:Arginine transporter n=1 Tax=Erwinia psidii TaxID=69224 RepID=A0A3N6RVK2_9GAMM|nr:LysE family transporter [Erwinia psidii]MCX8956941.1 arginine transporter [Erwinia psidii]MCX8960248.1 arginine transporter [Erwinia psidii]MCX8966266.1 arginine transporter [Erwinia psidii]RQM36974.1 arginine transporter [Erwinia psidii]